MSFLDTLDLLADAARAFSVVLGAILALQLVLLVSVLSLCAQMRRAINARAARDPLAQPYGDVPGPRP